MSKERMEDLLLRKLLKQASELTEALQNLAEVVRGVQEKASRARLEAEIARDTQRAIQLGRRLGYLSGRWPLRDGDSYGIVQKQPATDMAGNDIEFSQRVDIPGISSEEEAEIERANDTPRDIRSPDERGD